MKCMYSRPPCANTAEPDSNYCASHAPEWQRCKHPRCRNMRAGILQYCEQHMADELADIQRELHKAQWRRALITGWVLVGVVFILGLLVGRATAQPIYPTITINPYVSGIPEWGFSKYEVRVQSHVPWDEVVLLVEGGDYVGSRPGPLLSMTCKRLGQCPRPQIPCVTRGVTWVNGLDAWAHIRVYMQCHEAHWVDPGEGIAYWVTFWERLGQDLCVRGGNLMYRNNVVIALINRLCPLPRKTTPTWGMIKEMYR